MYLYGQRKVSYLMMLSVAKIIRHQVGFAVHGIYLYCLQALCINRLHFNATQEEFTCLEHNN
jgi:hypothetical protein